MTRKVLGLTLLFLVAGVFGNFLRYVEQKPDRMASFGEIPMILGGFSGEEHRFSDLSYEVLRADTSTLRRYVDPMGDRLWLFMAYFSSQKYGSQIHSPKHCLPGGGWSIEQIKPHVLELASGRELDVNRLVISEGSDRQLMFYWFETRGGALRSEFGLKFDLMRNSLLLRPTDAAIIRLTLSIRPGDNIESTSIRAEEFFETMLPSITSSLPF